MPHTRRRFLTAVPAVAAGALVAPGWLGAAAASTPTTAPPAPGTRQSPIDLRVADAVGAPELPALRVDYPSDVALSVRYVSRDSADPTGCATRGREETIEAEVPEGTAAVRLGGVRYQLAQFHFHTPSEHRINGRQAPVEQHFVHRGPGGELLVIGLLLTGDGPGSTLQDRVLDRLPAECGDRVELPGADLASSLPRDLTTFRYPGSLTTSPFTEGVSWLVLRRHRGVSPQSLDRFRNLFPQGDARDVQPLNGRVVRLRRQR